MLKQKLKIVSYDVNLISGYRFYGSKSVISHLSNIVKLQDKCWHLAHNQLVDSPDMTLCPACPVRAMHLLYMRHSISSICNILKPTLQPRCHCWSQLRADPDLLVSCSRCQKRRQGVNLPPHDPRAGLHYVGLCKDRSHSLHCGKQSYKPSIYLCKCSL